MAVASDLAYLINDADNHFNEPPDCFERYIDPSKWDPAVRFVTAPDGRKLQLFAGKPSKFNGAEGRLTQITFSDAELEDAGRAGTGAGHAGGQRGRPGGTVWVPYSIRKMDHAFLMGSKTRFSDNGRLDRRPSDIFKSHFVVAPYPEENVTRVVAEVGVEPIVFGSDFPHGEGLAYPTQYVGAQLSNFTDENQRRIMRDNLENFLTPR